jgi:hypothetical protein
MPPPRVDIQRYPQLAVLAALWNRNSAFRCLFERDPAGVLVAHGLRLKPEAELRLPEALREPLPARPPAADPGLGPFAGRASRILPFLRP